MRLSFPLKVEFEITSACNLRCNHCMLDHIHSTELKYETITALIDKWAEDGLLELQFTGGEPLLRDDLIDLVEYARNKGIKVLISTNGTLISESFAERLSKTGAYIEISLDGSAGHIHDSIRGTGAFDETIRGIEKLAKYNNRLMIETVVQRDNMSDLENIHLLARRLGAYRHLFHSLRISTPKLYPLSLTSAEMRSCQQRVFCLKRTSDIQVQPPYLPVNQYFELAESHMYDQKVFGCGALKFKCGVASDGSVWPCLLFKNLEGFKLGQLEDNDLRSIWNSSLSLSVYDGLHCGLPDTCEECDSKEHCDGGCRKAALSVLGSITEQDPSCPFSLNHYEKS